MQFNTSTLTFETTKPIDIIDITSEVAAALKASGLKEGNVTLLSRHTTACLNVNEKETMLVQDMITFLKRLAPRDGEYLHNLEPVDGRDNAHAHLIGLFMNSSETIPFSDGKLLLGEWQSIFLVELDGPRNSRQVLVRLLGE